MHCLLLLLLLQFYFYWLKQLPFVSRAIYFVKIIIWSEYRIFLEKKFLRIFAILHLVEQFFFFFFKAMSALNSSFAYTDNSMQRRHFQIERRPRMLKDFLIDDSNSCSSNGFKSFPRKASHCTVRNLLECDGGERGSNSNNKSTFLRSRSTAAATTISAFQKASEIVINAVKSPSFLQRSLKRRFWRRNSTEERGMKVTVIRVKDIVRMRSFRDVIEEKSAPSDSTGSITTTATTSSNGSSWCGSDFTADYVQSWSGNSEEYSGANAVKVGEKYLPGVGDGNANTTTRTTMSIDAVGPKVRTIFSVSHT